MSNVKAYLEDIVRDGLHDIAEALKGGGPSGDVQASHVIYDNTESGLTSTRVQGAIDELSTKVNSNASGISDLGDDVSNLTSRMGTAEDDITSLDGRLDTAEEDITALETWKDNLDAGDIPYGSGTVEDKLNELEESKEWTLVDSVSVTGAGGSSNVKTITLPSSYNELLVTVGTSNVTYGSCVCVSPSNGGLAISTAIDSAGNNAYSILAELWGTRLTATHTYNRYGNSLTVDAKVFYR